MTKKNKSSVFVILVIVLSFAVCIFGADLVSSYITIGLQNIISGLLIDRHSEAVVKVVDGVEQVVTEYDFVPVAVFWLLAVLLSVVIPVLNWRKLNY